MEGPRRTWYRELKKANGAFVQLYPVWRNNKISIRTKLRIFRGNVKAVLLYGSETWKVAKTTTSKLQVFVNRCLRRILNIHWPEVISNEEIWRRAEETEISVQIWRRKWNWIGHTLRKGHTKDKRTYKGHTYIEERTLDRAYTEERTYIH